MVEELLSSSSVFELSNMKDVKMSLVDNYVAMADIMQKFENKNNRWYDDYYKIENSKNPIKIVNNIIELIQKQIL